MSYKKQRKAGIYSRKRRGKSAARWRKPVFKRENIHRAEKIIINTAAGVLIFLIFLLVKDMVMPADGKRPAPLENVAAFAIPPGTLADLKSLSGKYSIDFAEALTVFSLENGFYPAKSVMPSRADIENTFIKNYKKIKKKYPKSTVKDYYEIISAILIEVEYFPLSQGYELLGGEMGYSFSDSFGSARTYGGSRKHTGTDIMDRENARGRIPVVSMTDGTVKDIGWGELGGYNIGVLTDKETYYYYAHFDRFADGLKKGDKVKAGQIIGFMGDSGYGDEGTKGKFAVHLHVGIRPKSNISKDDFWINPYPFLCNIEDMKVKDAWSGGR